MKKTFEDQITLHNGVTIPQHGFGVYKITDPAEMEIAIPKALEVGYRSFDTAQMYQNEAMLGELLYNSSVPRKDLFITTKINNGNQGYDQTLFTFEESLADLQLSQLDLLLVHWPSEKYFFDTWRAFERLYDEKMVRAIGVCNFHQHHLEKLNTKANVMPMVNQVELHPYLTQEALRNYLKEQNIAVEAWSPLARGRILNDPVLEELARNYHKTTAQIILRWHLQHELIFIPKSVTPSRIAENSDIYDFELSAEDMKKIDKLNRNQRTGSDPDDVYPTI
ncbi:aldo/keto reductase [Neobacillus sp. OS1-32]|uniref:aldo/keto reductase n=1 Tax=Neobacillus sp. OS1-32 TaxID=3070682 RepID=UPI0027E10C2A|nr:aldo/keto reductase [Neobacillus sp. OS1-32]WML28916.1 aldo/keto reductase [Neobacillus sp. OS1-32]